MKIIMTAMLLALLFPEAFCCTRTTTGPRQIIVNQAAPAAPAATQMVTQSTQSTTTAAPTTTGCVPAARCDILEDLAIAPDILPNPGTTSIPEVTLIGSTCASIGSTLQIVCTDSIPVLASAALLDLDIPIISGTPIGFLTCTEQGWFSSVTVGDIPFGAIVPSVTCFREPTLPNPPI